MGLMQGLMYALIIGVCMSGLFLFRLLVHRQLDRVLSQLTNSPHYEQEVISIRPAPKKAMAMQESTKHLNN